MGTSVRRKWRSPIPGLYLLIGLLWAAAGATYPARADGPAVGRRWVEEPSPTSRSLSLERRLALVIGNAAYAEHPLRTPEHDAGAVAATLRNLGFTVTVHVNCTRNEMRDDFNAFAESIRHAGSDSVAIVYYSGNAIHVAGKNYLAPVNFQMPEYAEDIGDNAVSVENALSKIQSAGAGVSIAVLDACRGNPFADTRSLAGNGLSSVEIQGMCIAFSAAEGQMAQEDGSSGVGTEIGLYTREFLRSLQTPGLSVHDVFKKTGDAVDDLTQHRQNPALYDGLIHGDQCYLAGRAAAPPPDTDRPGPPAASFDGTTLTIDCAVPGAQVTLDSASISVGQPVTYFIGPGATKQVLLVATAPGYHAKRMQLVLSPGPPMTVPVDLASESAPGPAGNVAEKPGGVTPGAAAMPAPPSPPPTVRTNRKDGAVMVYVPAGAFTMGDDTRYPPLSANVDLNPGGINDNPRHIALLSGYYVYRTPVTVRMYRRFCAETHHAAPPAAAWREKDDQPVVNVSWDDAQAYCAWAGAALPSEAQWEKAARGVEARAYPWGDLFDASLLWSSTSKSAPATHTVGGFSASASPCGALDMAGNVWQWCLDTYNPRFWTGPGAQHADPCNTVTIRPNYRVVRGGAWSTRDPDQCRSSFRAACRADRLMGPFRDSVGFRCVVVSPEP